MTDTPDATLPLPEPAPPPADAPWVVVLPEFAGPLDLLLSLIEKRELDISRLSLVAVTDQYLERISDQDAIDPDEVADFLVIAAKLLLLKSIALLPQDPEAEPDEDDPGVELTRLLIEYQRVRDLVQDLRALESSGGRAYPRPVPLELPDVVRPLAPITADALVRALERALRRRPVDPPAIEATVQEITIETQQTLLLRLLESRDAYPFDAVLDELQTRTEIVLTFLALLELLKARRLDVEQDTIYGPITVRRPAPEQVPGASAADGEEPGDAEAVDQDQGPAVDGEDPDPA